MQKIHSNTNEAIDKMAASRSDEEAVLKFQGLAKIIRSESFEQKM